MMNIFEVNKRIKQRPPFQMIDRVLEIEEGARAVGLKNLSVNEPYFAGHFPDSPIMPGVLIIEACAQLCSIAAEANGTDEDTLYVLLKVDGFKFVKPCIPGDQLVITVEKTNGGNGPLLSFAANVKVDGETRVKGNLSFTKVPKSTIYGG